MGEVFVLDNQTGLFIPKSVDFVNKLSTQIKHKTGFSLYVDIVDSLDLPTKDGRIAYEKSILFKITPPYSVIFFFAKSKKVDIVLSDDAKNIFDTERMFFDYMAPLLPDPKKESEFTPNRISAAILNVYSIIADKISDSYNVDFDQNFPKDKSREVVYYIIWAMLIVLIGLFAWVYFFPNKKKQR
ncbi:hypothetical protein BKH42_01035 [Helicobacter sp. 13S00482-2]|nr:hypothetical protein BKH42_01035 [Helicobacter sp. 13S00482-2]